MVHSGRNRARRHRQLTVQIGRVRDATHVPQLRKDVGRPAACTASNNRLPGLSLFQRSRCPAPEDSQCPSGRSASPRSRSGPQWRVARSTSRQALVSAHCFTVPAQSCQGCHEDAVRQIELAHTDRVKQVRHGQNFSRLQITAADVGCACKRETIPATTPLLKLSSASSTVDATSRFARADGLQHALGDAVIQKGDQAVIEPIRVEQHRRL